MRRCYLLLFAAVLATVASAEKLETFRVKENLASIWVDARAPYPPEIENETQARALSKDAAVVLGQNAILRHVLRKKTREGKTLEEAQIPSTDVQNEIKALIAGAQIGPTRFDKEGCRVRVLVQKKNLKVILRKT